VAVALLLLWVAAYLWLDPKSRLASFCGNAIADWSGSLVIILGTKFFYEVGSKESRRFRPQDHVPMIPLPWRPRLHAFFSARVERHKEHALMD
jgi:hypothetical protein